MWVTRCINNVSIKWKTWSYINSLIDHGRKLFQEQWSMKRDNCLRLASACRNCPIVCFEDSEIPELLKKVFKEAFELFHSFSSTLFLLSSSSCLPGTGICSVGEWKWLWVQSAALLTVWSDEWESVTDKLVVEVPACEMFTAPKALIVRKVRRTVK